MQLDWITVVAQIINFLILVWLLHRFLYGPITRAMERRENRIKERLDNAAQEREQAEAKQQELDKRLQELEDEREAKLEQARKEAEALQRKLEGEAREEVDRKREAWLAEMREHRQDFMTQLRETMSESFRDLAEDALRTLADSTLSERMAAVLLERLEELPEDDAERLADAARDAGRVTIESGQPLGSDIRRKLTRAVHDLIEDDVDVDYVGDTRGMVGIRLRAGSASIEWSVDEYLDRFAARLNSYFPAQAQGADTDDSEATDQRQPASSGAIHE